VATEIEGAFAAAGHIVVSNARNYRMDPQVPLLVPEVNAEHLSLVPGQAGVKGWKGRIVTNPNCSTVFLAMSLAPLRAFGLKSVTVTTLQAASGAGYPGVPSLDILGNVVPFISGEEEKIESETKRILGSVTDGAVVPHPVVISAQTTRVPVLDGHTESVSATLEQSASIDEVRAALEAFEGRPQQYGLPSAPPKPIVYLSEPNRPQPRLDAERGGGMVVYVGRLRPCSVASVKFIALGHNTVRGAAGAALLNAELMKAEGLL
jgi:aspartate-semialdehyde dehydrogenase